MTSKDFDLLRDKASALDFCAPRTVLRTKRLFLDVINCMEKLNGMITETEVDLAKHDNHGRVELED